MYKIDRESDDRLDIVISGKLDAEAMTAMLDEMLAEAKGVDEGRMLIDIEEFHMPSLAAIKIEMSRLPELLRFTRQFTRAAVLSDEAWVNTVSTLEGKLIPGLAIKSFRRDQRYQAESWLQSND